MATGYYTIALPTKPYIKKYLQSLYGSPLIFDRENFFGTSILGFLDKRFYTHQSTSLSYRHFDNFSAILVINMPGWWVKQASIMLHMTEGNMINLNKHFENRFEEDLVKFCIPLTVAGLEIKKSIELFCKIHDVKIGEESDDDITFDSILQKHKRKRKKLHKIYCKFEPPKKLIAKPDFAADILKEMGINLSL